MTPHKVNCTHFEFTRLANKTQSPQTKHRKLSVFNLTANRLYYNPIKLDSLNVCEEHDISFLAFGAKFRLQIQSAKISLERHLTWLCVIDAQSLPSTFFVALSLNRNKR